MSHLRIAVAITLLCALLIVLDGWLFSRAEHIALWHGIYCIWMTATTVGGDVLPTRYGYACLAFAPFPLLAALFSLITGAVADIHIRRAETSIKQHVTDQVTGTPN